MNLFSTKNITYFFFILLVLTTLFSCKEALKKKDLATANFYHWKINANLEDTEKEALEMADSKRVFLHYFDVIKDVYYEKPVAVIREIDAVLKEKEVIPVIFIRNSIFKKESFYDDYLVRRIVDLTTEIHKHHFNKVPYEIQIDCDWTESTRENYFKFLRALKEKIKVSVTIRLHQVKYRNKTGVPPVDSGTLMLYNVGDLKKKDENSILESAIVSQYISEDTTYPLRLDVALPIFSQLVLINNKGALKLINEPNFERIKSDTEHFKKETERVYRVKKKVLFKGQYLYEGYTIKLEESSIDEIVKTKEIVKNSNLNTGDLVLYHLDEKTLQEFNLSELLEKLK